METDLAVKPDQITVLLLHEGFRRDLRRLLWIDPSVNRGATDLGWNCRDHAVITAFILRTRGFTPSIVEGRCMYVQGVSGDRPPAGIGQELEGYVGHWWVLVPDTGFVDLSPNLGVRVQAWRPMDFFGLVADRLYPEGSGEVRMVGSRADYDQEIAKATHRPDHLTAVYLVMGKKGLTRDDLTDAVRRINSPLTDRLYRYKDQEIYGKAIVHLLGILDGTRRPLAGVSQNKAWSLVSTIPNGASREVLKLAGLDSDA